MAAKPTEAETDAAPDPEEDDLSDLDDVLDEFDSKPSLPTQPKPSASGPGRPSPVAVDPAPAPGINTTATPHPAPPLAKAATVEDAPAPAPALESEEDLAAQLQAGMSSLLSELGAAEGGGDPEMQAQFEAMMAELIGAVPAPATTSTSKSAKQSAGPVPPPSSSSSSSAAKKDAAAASTAGGAGGKEDPFATSIRRTMERMQASSSAATAASTASSAPKSEEEMLMEMLRSLSPGAAGAGGPMGAGEEDDFNAMLLGMMTQLVHKEILYEPMKELDSKFPGWMEKNEGKVPREDWERYLVQRGLVREIVERFERSGYSDEDEGDREFIVERMQKMQEAGSPPPDLVGDMSAAQEALGELDAGCPTQ